jgi:hypothetical protein
MKNWFFHQENGSTLGPITLDQIKSRVREGRIRLFDLVYREGEPGWRMALEHPDLRNEFKTSTVKTLVDRPWVCLQRKSEAGFEFGTSGPFSTDDIRLMIQEGLISYSDYVWRDGFSEWRRIGSLEDFNRRLSEARERKDRRGTSGSQSPLPDVPAQELIKNVVEMKRGAPPSNPAVPPPAPPEAATPDLTAPGAVPPPIEKRKKSKLVDKERRGKPSAGRPMEETPTPGKASRRRTTAAWVDWLIVGVLAVVLFAVALNLTHHRKAQKTADLEAPAPAPSPVPPTAPEPEFETASEPPPELPPDLEPMAEVEEEKRAAAAKNENRTPTELILNVQSTGPNQVKIELRTDASGEEYPVYVQIIGLPGQVSDGASYYKFLRLSAKGDRKEALDLSGMSLPQGRFILRAETGTLKREAKLNVGVNEAAFKQTVVRLRKVHAHAIWKERLELFRLSQLLEKQLTDALGGQKFSGKGLEAIEAVRRSAGTKYILYDQWFEMREILKAAKTAPSMALLGRLKQARERLATFSVWK